MPTARTNRQIHFPKFIVFLLEVEFKNPGEWDSGSQGDYEAKMNREAELVVLIVLPITTAVFPRTTRGFEERATSLGQKSG